MKTIHARHPMILMLLAIATSVLALRAKEVSMKISSPDFNEGASIPSRFTCDGANVNPTLQVSGVPSAAKSLVLIVDDPDAPAGTWTHWLIWNLKADLTEIPAHSVPAGAVQGVNDFGKSNYGGPCPPSGTHRYFFHLYALDSVLELPAHSNRKALDQAMRGHIVGEGKYMGRYARSR